MSSSTTRFGALAAALFIAACSDSTGVGDSAVSVESSSNCSGTAGIAVGQVLSGLAGTTLCFSGAVGGEFALIPFNASANPDASASLTVSLTGTTTAAAATTTIASASDLFATTSSTLRASRLPGFERRLRGLERAALPRLMSPARSWRTQRRAAAASGLSPRFAISASAAVDQLVRLNANAESACGTADYRTGRVAAISERAIVVTDTANPVGGFTDADYASIAATFDTLVDPVDRLNFGDPTDIDENGHVVMFFTRAVNELTPKNSSSFVGGFFFARDLFPAAGTSADACAGSNVGEMFYLMVPDPSGTVNGNVFTKTNVRDDAIATVGHEYQHLINASRRVYINDATDWEEPWLDEGLSHIAEELLFYRASSLTPGANLDAAKLRASQRSVDAVNEYQTSNLGRYSEYLGRPATSSPYASDDSLWSRGATWSFLRYLADRHGGDQAALWHQLANSSTVGLTNLQSAFGVDVASVAHDWAVSVLTDDLAAVTASFTQPSWNYRSIYPALGITSFPLKTLTPAAGVATPISVDGGGAAYLRFIVTAGQPASIEWSALPTTMNLSLVRIR